jgi:Tfp pilus assembly protein FimT
MRLTPAKLSASSVPVSFDSINAAADFKQMKAPLTQKGPRIAAGFSVFELLIVVAMISVLTGFALIR